MYSNNMKEIIYLNCREPLPLKLLSTNLKKVNDNKFLLKRVFELLSHEHTQIFELECNGKELKTIKEVGYYNNRNDEKKGDWSDLLEIINKNFPVDEIAPNYIKFFAV